MRCSAFVFYVGYNTYTISQLRVSLVAICETETD